METIKIYLENMFMNLPESEQVIKAKQELLAMMEDKYNELKESGRTENEAVGIVISEFGNLDELAEELGIKETVEQAEECPAGRVITMETVKSYLSVNAVSAARIAVGVFLCICSPILLIVLGGMSENNMGITENVAGGIGVGALFILIAIAVALFVYNGMALSKFDYLQMEPFQMEYSVKQYVSNLQETHRPTFVLYITIGVVMCVISVVPLVVAACIDEDNEFLVSAMVGVMLFVIAIAVVLFIVAGMKEGAYNILLQKNEYAPEVKENKLMQTVSSCYWIIVTAGYLLWSFITMDWHITWIVWPIAGLLYAVIAVIINAAQNKEG